MSRVGKVPIPIPDNVKVVLSGNDVSVQGPKGKLSRVLPDGVNVATEDGQILVTRPDDGRRARERHGLVRSLVNNMVVGVTTGYEKQLEIVGVGYRAELTGDYLRFDLGYSHPIFYEIPVGITAEVASPTKVKVSGVDKEIVGETAAKIRSFRPPEPYKGKGIRFAGEVIRTKVGKAGVA